MPPIEQQQPQPKDQDQQQQQQPEQEVGETKTESTDEDNVEMINYRGFKVPRIMRDIIKRDSSKESERKIVDSLVKAGVFESKQEAIEILKSGSKPKQSKHIDDQPQKRRERDEPKDDTKRVDKNLLRYESLVKTQTEQLETLKRENQQLHTQFRENMISNDLERSLSKSGIHETAIRDAKKLIKDDLFYSDEHKRLCVKAYDDNNNPILDADDNYVELLDEKGDIVSVESYIKKWVNDRPHMITSTKKTGVNISNGGALPDKNTDLPAYVKATQKKPMTIKALGQVVTTQPIIQ